MRMFVMAFLLAATAQAADFPTWMTGSWGATIDGVKMQEHWTTSEGGIMLGTHRDVRSGGKVFFEFLRIVEKDGTLVYMAMPGGRPPTSFPLKERTASRIVFENLQHDFPQRVIYWRDRKKLCARVEGTMGGRIEREQWCWNRM